MFYVYYIVQQTLTSLIAFTRQQTLTSLHLYEFTIYKKKSKSIDLDFENFKNKKHENTKQTNSIKQRGLAQHLVVVLDQFVLAFLQ